MAGQIGHISSYKIADKKLIAHGFEWVVKSRKEYDHWGKTRFSIKATKPKGRKVFTMVIYENNTISGAV